MSQDHGQVSQEPVEDRGGGAAFPVTTDGIQEGAEQGRAGPSPGRCKNTKEGLNKYSGVERLNVMEVSILQKSVCTFCKTPPPKRSAVYFLDKMILKLLWKNTQEQPGRAGEERQVGWRS